MRGRVRRSSPPWVDRLSRHVGRSSAVGTVEEWRTGTRGGGTGSMPDPGTSVASTQRRLEPAHEEPLVGGGRIVALDIVRGFAILWVVVYHLWSDFSFFDVGTVEDRFGAVPELIGAGKPLNALRAIVTAFLRV